MKRLKAIIVLPVLGCLWLASGYLLYEYVFPSALAYFVFPFICFGVMPYIRGILWMIVAVLLVVGVLYGTGRFLCNIMLFQAWLAYATLPVILIAAIILDSVISPNRDNKEDEGGISKNQTG